MKALKFDGEKPPLDLLPNDALEQVALVLGFGAKKYKRYNWTGGFQYSRLISAAMRHLAATNRGEDEDEESGYYTQPTQLVAYYF